jgi:hypothetical protein
MSSPFNASTGLAGAYLDAGWLDGAISLYERLLADSMRVLGEAHVFV